MKIKRPQFKNESKSEDEKKDLDILLLIPIFIILFIITMSEARAQESVLQLPATESSTSVSEPIDADSDKKFQLPISLERSSNLQKESSPDRDDATSIIFNPVYKISARSAIESRIDLIFSDEKERSLNLSNTAIVYTPTTVDLLAELKFKPNISVTLPTDDEVRDNHSYQGAISVRPTFEYSVSQVKGLTLANVVYFNKNFHEFKNRRDYTPNTQHSIRNRFVVFYEVTGKLSLEFVNDFVKSWTYNGYSKEDFYFAQELRYAFEKNWSTYLGHKNEGSTRGPNNNGDNVDAFGEKTSYVSVGLTHVF